jgi:hypothetical protein
MGKLVDSVTESSRLIREKLDLHLRFFFLRCADIGLLLDLKHTLESRILNLNRMSELLDKP